MFWVRKRNISLASTNGVGTQKNRLTETVLLSTTTHVNTCIQKYCIRTSELVYLLICNAILKKQSLNINNKNTVICKYPILTLKGPPIICSRRQFQILPPFRK